MDERENVLSLCKQIIEGSETIVQEEGIHEIIIRIAKHINERAMKIKRICSVEKYKIFFHGKVGIGKTTTISALSGLVDWDSREKDDFILLKTSSGRTTPCETVFIKNKDDVDKIIVEKLSEEEFKCLLEEYCDSFFKPEVKIPEETKRIFNNMLDLKISDSPEEKLKKIKDELGISEIDLKTLLEYAEEKINHAERKGLSYCLDAKDKLGSLKKILSNIIVGKQEGCPYPKKITISLSSEYFNLQIPDYIESVIDTKGIESPERKDINDTMKELDTITVMCDEIGSFGGDNDINSILKSSLIEENKDETMRVFYLGLERGQELNRVERSGKRQRDRKKDKERGSNIQI